MSSEKVFTDRASSPPRKRLRLSKRKVDMVIDKSYWEGFRAGLGGSSVGGLEYASTSGFYAYNGVRRIAEQAGHDEARRLLREHVAEVTGERTGRKIAFPYEYKIPGAVIAECYGEARLA